MKMLFSFLGCLPFLKSFVLPRAKRADENSVNTEKEEEKKGDSLSGYS
jgi:hypothetical protein